MISWPNNYMLAALEQAKLAVEQNEVPVGAIIVDWQQNSIIAATHNLCEKSQDVTAHAEMLAIREACLKFNNYRLNMCDLYVTLEPCPMCASAISLARIRRLYFGAYDVKGGGVINGAKIFDSSSCHHFPEVYPAIGEVESSNLLKKFFIGKR
jgi:tRNA(Arg) A34 adenosine deaminase TadA